jgi:hypothetical protein
LAIQGAIFILRVLIQETYLWLTTTVMQFLDITTKKENKKAITNAMLHKVISGVPKCLHTFYFPYIPAWINDKNLIFFKRCAVKAL